MKKQIQEKLNEILTEPIAVNRDIWQYNSLSHLLVNVIMDEIIRNIRLLEWYRIAEIIILCYANDAVLVAENDDDQQRLLHLFYCTAKSFNMMISVHNGKTERDSKHYTGNLIHEIKKLK